MSGKLSKAFFLLFCSFLVYPLNYTGDSVWSINFATVAFGLTIVAAVQITKYCCNNGTDSHDEEAAMDDAPKVAD